MIHLKYLSFKYSNIEKSLFVLPKWIGMLQNLEILDLWTCRCFHVIPKVISQIPKLRHLLGYNMSWFQLKGVIGRMESLWTLSEVKIDVDGVELIREMGKLRQLRKLGLVGVNREHESALSSSLNEMRHLEKLRIGLKRGHIINCGLPAQLLMTLIFNWSHPPPYASNT